MLEIPVIRWGEPYESMDKMDVVHFETGETLAQVHEAKPDVLLMFASSPEDLPEIRNLIDTVREIGASSHTQIAVGGGVFNRAEGLAEEIGADTWATDLLELVHTLIEEPARRADEEQRTVGRKRRAAA